MRTLERRPLTPGEIEFGRSVFGEEIAWPLAQVLQAPAWGFVAMVPLGRTIVFAKWRAAYDFSEAPLGEQGWFIHELAHVWQAGRGTILAGAKLNALGKRAYAYTPHADAALGDYNIERQAEIARHLFLARAGALVKDGPPRDWLEQVWAAR